MQNNTSNRELLLLKIKIKPWAWQTIRYYNGQVIHACDEHIPKKGSLHRVWSKFYQLLYAAPRQEAESFNSINNFKNN